MQDFARSALVKQVLEGTVGRQRTDDVPFAVELLGSVGVRLGGREVPVTSPKERSLLALLALRSGHVANVDSLVDGLTRRVSEPYEDYIERVAENEVARRVKIADLRENLANNQRLPEAPGNAERIDRYEAALARLAGPS